MSRTSLRFGPVVVEVLVAGEELGGSLKRAEVQPLGDPHSPDGGRVFGRGGDFRHWPLAVWPNGLMAKLPSSSDARPTQLRMHTQETHTC